MIIEDIYEQLRNDNVVKSAYEFSERFLNKCPTYYSVIKSRSMEPKLDTLLYLETQLYESALFYKKYNTPYFIRTYNHIVKLNERISTYNKGIIGMHKICARNARSASNTRVLYNASI